MRSWFQLYIMSVHLGLRYLLRHGYLREEVIRVVIPLDPSRYIELPDAFRELEARPGERVLDLASPKLLAVYLARHGVHVTSVDLFERYIETWRRLTDSELDLEFCVADGRELPFKNASFHHAYSVSVLEHIPDGGDELALRELSRVVRPGGRVVVTLPYTSKAWEEWRDQPVYGETAEQDGRFFFQRWYDETAIKRLVAAAPHLRLISQRVACLKPNWNAAYNRFFPWLIPLGLFFGFLAHEHEGSDGDLIRLIFIRQ